MIRHLQRRQVVPASPEQVWEFFATPLNLNLLTPSSLRFRIVGNVTAPMYAGQLIEYRLSFLPGLWTQWVTEITHLEAGRSFVDEQRIGPYRLWHHEHRFEPVAGGVAIHDHVSYDVGWGFLGAIADRLWVHRTMNAIFDHRAKKISELFAART